MEDKRQWWSGFLFGWSSAMDLFIVRSKALAKAALEGTK